MVSTRRLVALAAVCASSVIAAVPEPRAQAPADRTFDTVAELVTAKMHQYNVPGVALGVLHDGTITIRGFGVTSVEDPLPVIADTIVPLASISKTVTATAMMRLVEQGTPLVLSLSKGEPPVELVVRQAHHERFSAKSGTADAAPCASTL